MLIDRKAIRKFRIPLLILLIITIIGTFISFNGGLVILAYDSYPQNRQMPQVDNITAQASIRQDGQTRTILPGLLYYYHITPVNVLEILVEAPMQRDYTVAGGELTLCELSYSDGRSVSLAAYDKPVPSGAVNGGAVTFVFDIPELKECDLTLNCKAYLESGDGKKVLSSIFKKMTFTKKRDFYLRSMVNKNKLEF